MLHLGILQYPEYWIIRMGRHSEAPSLEAYELHHVMADTKPCTYLNTSVNTTVINIVMIMILCEFHRFAISKSMPPRKASSTPLGDIVEIVTETRRTPRGLRTTEKEVCVRSSKDTKSGQTPRSQSRRKTVVKKGNTSGHISSDDDETIPLRRTNPQDDIPEGQGDDEVAMEDYGDSEGGAAAQDTHQQGNVCSLMTSHTSTSNQLQTPMDQWIQVRSRYLHLLLEMEGVTKSPNCSQCGSAMAIKCGDCIGGNYFCVACCLQAHKRFPFHRMSQWTGAHFSPISLYSLGFKLCLEHDGEPCPLTVDVSHLTID